MTRILSGSLALAFVLTNIASPGLAAAPARPAPPPDKAPPASPRPSPAATKPSPKPTPSPVLAGSVRGPDGKPVEGALVLSRPVGAPPRRGAPLVPYRPLAAPYRELAATRRTDVEGRFRAELKTAGAAYVRVTAKGLA